MKKKHLIIIFFILTITICLIMLVLFKKNIEIINLKKSMKAPDSDITYIEKTLYNFVNNNSKNHKYSAVLRKNSYTEYTLKDKRTSAIFIVDIPSHQISYKINYTWPRKNETYQIQINCLLKKDLIFPEKECNGTDYDYSRLKLMEKYPIYEKLPITYEKYNFNSRSTTKYRIEGYFDDEKYIIVIKDYSGDNKERALEHIKSLGYNPEDYIIKYKF